MESIVTEAESAWASACGRARSSTTMEQIHEVWAAAVLALGALLARGREIAHANPGVPERLDRVVGLREAAKARAELHS